MSDAYFCLVTWPDGKEGLLFPRPGNVPINTTFEQGAEDFGITVSHLKKWVDNRPEFKGTKVSLVKFARLETVMTFPAPPTPEAVPDTEAKCKKCGRQMRFVRTQGYVCDYCTMIED